jgi:hypothetical protein
MKLVDVYTSDEGGPQQITPAAAISILAGSLEIPDEDVVEFDLSSARKVDEAWQALREVDNRKLFILRYPEELDRMSPSVGLGNNILGLYSRIQENYFAGEKIPVSYTIIQIYGDYLMRALSKRGAKSPAAANKVPRIELNPQEE